MSEELTSPHLPAVGLVAQLSKEDRDTLSSYGEFHLADHGEILILHAVRHEDERDVLLGTIQKGEWVGEVDLFDPGSAMCSVMVIEPVQYWAATRSDVEDFINNYPEAGVQIVVGVATTLSKRLRVVTKKLMEEAEMAEVRAALLAEGRPE
jgi:CRP-like cAMP-binding protein